MEENESKEEVVKKEEQQAEIETSENTEKIEKQDEKENHFLFIIPFIDDCRMPIK